MPALHNPPKRRRSKLSFSLRSLLLVALLVSVYLAGRYGTRVLYRPALVGSWQANMPAGFKRPVTLSHLEANRYLLTSRASVFNGTYEWADGKLTIVEPSDKRMGGLTWSWDGERMLLTAEPQGTPTGSSYLGTTLVRVKPSGQ